MPSEPMASVDAAWLHMDKPTNRMVVNCVFWFEKPMDWRRLEDVLAERLVARFPRFRQRVQDPLVTVGYLSGPVWTDDEQFDLGRHVHRARLRGRSAQAAVQTYVSDHMSGQLPTDRPLWEAHFLDTPGPRSAVLLRTHHAIADGTALMHVLLTLRDPEPDGSVDLVGRAVIPASRSRVGLPVVDRLVEATGTATARAARIVDIAARRSLAVLEDPRRLRDVAGSLFSDATMLHKLGFGLPVDHTALFGPLGVEKQVRWSKPVDLDLVKTVGRHAGATVNDVMLGLLAGGLRRHLESRDLPVKDVVVTVPYNVRAAEEKVTPELGNRFGLVFVQLPATVADPLERIKIVKRQMDEIKSSNEGVFVYGVLGAAGRTPRQVQRAWIDLFAGKADAVVTNIAGPREEVRIAGVPLSGFVAWVPTTGPVGVGLSIVSYNGAVVVGVAVDKGIVPDSSALLRAIEAEFRLLRTLTAA